MREIWANLLLIFLSEKGNFKIAYCQFGNLFQFLSYCCQSMCFDENHIVFNCKNKRKHFCLFESSYCRAQESRLWITIESNLRVWILSESSLGPLIHSVTINIGMTIIVQLIFLRIAHSRFVIQFTIIFTSGDQH